MGNAGIYQEPAAVDICIFTGIPVRALIFLFLLTIHFRAAAQQDTAAPKLYAIAGIGNYEYLWGGIGLTFEQKICTEAGFGIKPWYFGTTYTQAHISAGMLLASEMKRIKNIAASVHVKCFAWQLENEFNYFMAIGIGPELRLSYKRIKRLHPALNIGGLYNTVIKYERKTFDEAGWPREFQPSFSVQLNYRLK